MKYDELTYKVIGCAMKVHNVPGNGFQEVIYQRRLAIEMLKACIEFMREGGAVPPLGDYVQRLIYCHLLPFFKPLQFTFKEYKICLYLSIYRSIEHNTFKATKSFNI